MRLDAIRRLPQKANNPLTITGEVHTIEARDTDIHGSYGTIYLDEIPYPGPNNEENTVTITSPSGISQVTGNPSGATQFYCDYDTGILYFDVTLVGTSITINYQGMGAAVTWRKLYTQLDKKTTYVSDTFTDTYDYQSRRFKYLYEAVDPQAYDDTDNFTDSSLIIIDPAASGDFDMGRTTSTTAAIDNSILLAEEGTVSIDLNCDTTITNCEFHGDFEFNISENKAIIFDSVKAEKLTIGKASATSTLTVDSLKFIGNCEIGELIVNVSGNSSGDTTQTVDKEITHLYFGEVSGNSDPSYINIGKLDARAKTITFAENVNIDNAILWASYINWNTTSGSTINVSKWNYIYRNPLVAKPTELFKVTDANNTNVVINELDFQPFSSTSPITTNFTDLDSIVKLAISSATLVTGLELKIHQLSNIPTSDFITAAATISNGFHVIDAGSTNYISKCNFYFNLKESMTPSDTNITDNASLIKYLASYIRALYIGDSNIHVSAMSMTSQAAGTDTRQKVRFLEADTVERTSAKLDYVYFIGIAGASANTETNFSFTTQLGVPGSYHKSSTGTANNFLVNNIVGIDDGRDAEIIAYIPGYPDATTRNTEGHYTVNKVLATDTADIYFSSTEKSKCDLGYVNSASTVNLYVTESENVSINGSYSTSTSTTDLLINVDAEHLRFYNFYCKQLVFTANADHTIFYGCEWTDSPNVSALTPGADVKYTNAVNIGTGAQDAVEDGDHTLLANLDGGDYKTGDHTYVAQRYEAASDPTANNDDVDTAGAGIKFKLGAIWVNTSSNTTFICTDNTSTSAVWFNISTLTKDHTALTNVNGGTYLMGGHTGMPQLFVDALNAPTANDDGVGTGGNTPATVGAIWLENVSGSEQAWICTDTTTGAANWVAFGSTLTNPDRIAEGDSKVEIVDTGSNAYEIHVYDGSTRQTANANAALYGAEQTRDYTSGTESFKNIFDYERSNLVMAEVTDTAFDDGTIPTYSLYIGGSKPAALSAIKGAYSICNGTAIGNYDNYNFMLGQNMDLHGTHSAMIGQNADVYGTHTYVFGKDNFINTANRVQAVATITDLDFIKLSMPGDFTSEYTAADTIHAIVNDGTTYGVEDATISDSECYLISDCDATLDMTTAEPGSPAADYLVFNTVTGVSSGTGTSVTANKIYRWDTGTSTWIEYDPDYTYITLSSNLTSATFNGNTAYITKDDTVAASYSLIVGNTNTVGGMVSSAVIGEDHYEIHDATRGLFVGENNKANTIINTTLLGIANTASDSDNSLISGYGNKLVESDSCFLVGQTNGGWKSDYSMYLGYSNQARMCRHSLLAGKNNFMMNSFSSTLLGESNIVNKDFIKQAVYDDELDKYVIYSVDYTGILDTSTSYTFIMNYSRDGWFHETSFTSQISDLAYSGGDTEFTIDSLTNQGDVYQTYIVVTTNSESGNYNLISGYNNDVIASNAAVIAAKNIDCLADLSIVAGQDHKIRADRSLVVGDNIDGYVLTFLNAVGSDLTSIPFNIKQYPFIGNATQLIIVDEDGTIHIADGFTLTVTTSTCTVSNFGLVIRDGVSYDFIFSSATHCLIGGEDNVIAQSSHATVSGKDHFVFDSQYATISGNANVSINGDNTAIFGYNNITFEDSSFTIGESCKAGGDKSVALGNAATAGGDSSLAINSGTTGLVLPIDDITIGVSSITVTGTGDYSGFYSVASGTLRLLISNGDGNYYALDVGFSNVTGSTPSGNTVYTLSGGLGYAEELSPWSTGGFLVDASFGNHCLVNGPSCIGMGASSIVSGLSCESHGTYNLVVGQNITDYLRTDVSACSALFGYGHANVVSNFSLIGGKNNSCTGHNALISGEDNIVGENSDYCAVFGYDNEVYTSMNYALIGGSGNYAFNPAETLFGYNNTNIVGKSEASLTFGDSAKSKNPASLTQAAGKISAVGDAQAESVVMKVSTSAGTSITDSFETDVGSTGLEEILYIPADDIWAIEADVFVKILDSASSVYEGYGKYKLHVIAYNDSGTVTLSDTTFTTQKVTDFTKESTSITGTPEVIFTTVSNGVKLELTAAHSSNIQIVGVANIKLLELNETTAWT